VSNSRRIKGDGWNRAPCGCAFRVDGDVFIIWPCSLDCRVYLYTQVKAAEQGKRFTPVHIDPAELN
jgi:hypothetical protein